jgi:PAS domain S-box-containing protein
MYDMITYGALLDNSKDSITIKSYENDGNGNYQGGWYQRVSKVKAAHHGLTRAQMRGKTDYDFLSKEEADRARAVDIWVMTHMEQFDTEEEKIVRNGKTIWYNTSVIPLVLPERNNPIVYGTMCIARNITKRVEAQHRSKRLLRFLKKRLNNPLTSILPIIDVLGPKYANISRTLKEMQVRMTRIIQDIEGGS